MQSGRLQNIASCACAIHAFFWISENLQRWKSLDLCCDDLHRQNKVTLDTQALWASCLHADVLWCENNRDKIHVCLQCNDDMFRMVTYICLSFQGCFPIIGCHFELPTPTQHCDVVTMGKNNNIPFPSSKDHFHQLKMWQNFRVIPKQWRNVTSGVTAWPLIVVATAPAPLNELTLSQLISAHAHQVELKPVISNTPQTSLFKYWFDISTVAPVQCMQHCIKLILSQLISAHALLLELKAVIWSGPHTSVSKYW